MNKLSIKLVIFAIIIFGFSGCGSFNIIPLGKLEKQDRIIAVQQDSFSSAEIIYKLKSEGWNVLPFNRGDKIDESISDYQITMVENIRLNQWVIDIDLTVYDLNKKTKTLNLNCTSLGEGGCWPHDTAKQLALELNKITVNNLLPKKNRIVKNNHETIDQNMFFDYKINEMKNHDSFALVIGINKYTQNTPVEYADLSAMAFKELANKTLGIPKENIITLLDEQATSGQLKAKIEIIKELADKNGNLYVYFAGHGVPGKDGNTYILPSDMSADNIHLEPNLMLDNLYSQLSKTSAKNVFVFMDTCFSGKDDKGGLLYKGVAPILKTKKTVIDSSKLTVLTAGSSNDFANEYQDKKQRLFSYYLIKELAEGNTNLQEIYSTIKDQVKRASLLKGIGYKQVPQIYGNENISLY